MLLQEELIIKVRDNGSITSCVNAIMMYGSFTQGCGDTFSDIEFYVFIEDNSYTEFDSCPWVTEIHPVAAHLINEYGTEVFIFENLIRGEFHFLPVEGMSIIETFSSVGFFPDIDAMCLYDKNDMLKRNLKVLKGCYVDRTSSQNIENVVNNFFNAILYGINVLKRGELARSLECLGTVQKYFLQLLRIDEGKTDHWVNPVKALESEISSTQYYIYKKCTSDLEEKNLLLAYQELLSNCESIVKELSSRYSFDYNHALFQRLIEYIG
jgi:lincosamide nucleotidyltransferase